MNEQTASAELIDLAAEIVSAYVSNNSVPAQDLPTLISEVHRALSSTHQGMNQPEPEPLKPAVNPKKSVFPDHIVCLEDGKKFKSLKRHLRTHYDLSPEEYREKWGLPGRLSDGRPELRRGAFGACQEDGSRPAAPPQVAGISTPPLQLSSAAFWRRMSFGRRRIGLSSRCLLRRESLLQADMPVEVVGPVTRATAVAFRAERPGEPRDDDAVAFDRVIVDLFRRYRDQARKVPSAIIGLNSRGDGSCNGNRREAAETPDSRFSV